MTKFLCWMRCILRGHDIPTARTWGFVEVHGVREVAAPSRTCKRCGRGL